MTEQSERKRGHIQFNLHINQAEVAAYRSAANAKDGDTRSIEKRLRAGVRLSQAERDFLADSVSGKLDKPAHRPESRKTLEMRRQIAQFVVIYQRLHACKRESAIAAARKEFGVSRRYAFSAMQEVKKDNFWAKALPSFADFVVAELKQKSECVAEVDLRLRFESASK